MKKALLYSSRTSKKEVKQRSEKSTAFASPREVKEFLKVGEQKQASVVQRAAPHKITKSKFVLSNLVPFNNVAVRADFIFVLQLRQVSRTFKEAVDFSLTVAERELSSEVAAFKSQPARRYRNR